MAKIKEITFTHKLSGTRGKTKVHYLLKYAQFAVDIPPEFDPEKKLRTFGATEKEAITAFHTFMNSEFQLSDYLKRVIQYRLGVCCSAPNPDAETWDEKWGIMAPCVNPQCVAGGSHLGVGIRASSHKKKLEIEYHVTWVDTRENVGTYMKYYSPDGASVEGFSRDNHTLSDAEEIPFTAKSLAFFEDLALGIERLAYQAINWFLQDDAKSLMKTGIKLLPTGE